MDNQQKKEQRQWRKENRTIDKQLRKQRENDSSVEVDYTPTKSIEYVDNISDTGIFDTRKYTRKELVNLAQKLAGSKTTEDIDLRNKLITEKIRPEDVERREGLFMRKFNNQLKSNLRRTAKMQEIENAKNGDVTALGRYQNYAKEDVAKVLAPLVVGVPMAGTGVLGTLAGGVKSIYANPMMRFGLDMSGTTDGIKNLFTDNGVQKTIRAIQEGDYLGAIKSGAGDIFDVVSIVDLPKSVKSLSNLKNYQKPYSFKYVDNIGDEGSRWKHINDTDVDLTYKKYVDEEVVDPKTLPRTMVTPTSTFKSDNSLEDFIFLNDEIYADETKVQWLIDNLKGKSKAEADAFLAEISSPNSPYYNDYVKASDVSYLRDHLNNTEATIDAKKKIVERGREVEKALNFVADGIHARNPLTREDADFITQLTSGGIRTYRKPKFSFDFSLTGSDYNSYLSKDRKRVTMGWLDPGEEFYIPRDNVVLRNGPVAAHEGAHGYRKYNERGNETAKYPFMTDSQKETYLKQLSVDSPRYKNDYSGISERAKKLLTPTMDVNDHDIELSEGYSDAWGTRFNLFDKGISSAALDPTKKYTYLDLIRYKMTPTGMTDRFIRQRGGWWKGWKQQLDALNEVYKNGGKL